jgi:hypothetical protein
MIPYVACVEGNEPKTNQPITMKYAKQPNQPDWFQSDESKLYESATSGAHFLNGWYEFDDRADALDLIGKAFDSQSFLDRFTPHTDGEIYEFDQFTTESMETAVDSDGYVLKDNAKPASLAAMIDAESPF